MTGRWDEEERKKRAAKAKEWRKNNPEKVKEQKRRYRLKYKDKRKEYRDNNSSRFILYDIKSRATKAGLPFNLEKEDIDNYNTCPVFGFKMERGTIKETKNSPSVDRIIPSLGYVKGNIQIISSKANRMKQDATPEELRMFAKWVLKTFPEEQDGKH